MAKLVNRSMDWNLTICSAFAALIMGLMVLVTNLSFEAQCGNYLERSANAATVEVANQELSKALHYMESHEMTSGSSHLIYAAPDTDVTFFYTNLKNASKELEAVAGDQATQLDKSNTLLRFHEMLLDKDGNVDAPDLISLFPDQKFFGYGSLVILLAFIIFGIRSGLLV